MTGAYRPLRLFHYLQAHPETHYYRRFFRFIGVREDDVLFGQHYYAIKAVYLPSHIEYNPATRMTAHYFLLPEPTVPLTVDIRYSVSCLLDEGVDYLVEGRRCWMSPEYERADRQALIISGASENWETAFRRKYM